MTKLAPESLEQLRTMSSQQVYDTVKGLAYQAGGSGEYLALMEEIVGHGLLTPEEIELFEDTTTR